MSLRVLFVAGALVLGGCKPPVADKPIVPVIEVAEADVFVREVKAEGTLEAVEATHLLAPADADGPLKIAWLAEDGTHVKAGDVVVRFDDTDAKRKAADSGDDVKAAERAMSKVQVESKTTRHKREATGELADFERVVAEEFVSDDTEVFSRNEIIESTIDVELADAKATHSDNVAGVEKNVSGHNLALHRIDKQRATREVERAETELANLEVTAPHDGLVVLERNWRGDTVRVGDTIWRGQKLGELPQAGAMQAPMFVLEADAGNLVPGLAADLRVEAHPGKMHAATIERVDNLAKPRHPDVPVHYVGIMMKLAETDPKTMRIGQRVTAVIRIEKPDALVVPRSAVFDRDGATVVYRKDGDDFEAVEVETGMASPGRVVVESGIEAGDVLALRDPDRKEDDGKEEEAKSGDAKGGAG